MPTSQVNVNSTLMTGDVSKACEELVQRDIEGWEFFVETNGVLVYRKPHPASGLYEYKIYGVLEGIPIDVCVAVYEDVEYRKVWDSNVKELKRIKEGEKDGIYWCVKFPFPMTNRDYVYTRHLKEMKNEADGGETVWTVVAASENFATCPPEKGAIRVEDYATTAAFAMDGKGGTKVFMYYYDDPKGSIPTWLINWAAKTGVPNFLTSLKKACDSYAEYKAARKEGKS